MKKSEKIFKGSVMLWAVCSLLVAVIVISGILSLSLSYLNEEYYNESYTQASFYARSGIELAADIIQKDNTVAEHSRMVFEWAEINITKKNDVLILNSTGFCGEVSKSISGYMKKNGDVWRFEGYAEEQ